jgi:hypothetical protein
LLKKDNQSFERFAFLRGMGRTIKKIIYFEHEQDLAPPNLKLKFEYFPLFLFDYYFEISIVEFQN